MIGTIAPIIQAKKDPFMPERILKMNAAGFRQLRPIDRSEVNAEAFLSGRAAGKQPCRGQHEVHDERNREYRYRDRGRRDRQGGRGRVLTRGKVVVHESDIIQVNTGEVQQPAKPDHDKTYSKICHS